jgi:3-deoxy-D-manno-octulosonic-acid transferase
MNFFIYRISYKTLRLLLSLFSFLLPDKIRAIVADRKNLKLNWREKPKAQPIWFHCASGEIEYIKSLLRKLKQEQPTKALFLTYFSPSGKPMAEKAVFQSCEADGFAPLPWDEPSYLQKFLAELNPQTLIISRTDLWPELLKQCQEKNIPTLLVAATFAPGSKKMSLLGKIFLSLSLPLLNKICVVSEEDKNMAQKFFPKLNFVVTGDPRFDQVIYRICEQQRELPANIVTWATEPTWLAGSTWPEDEAVLIPSLIQLNTQNTTLPMKLILVPHETDTAHLQLLATRLQTAGINFELFSKIDKKEINNNIQVLIFDQKGYLLDLYRLASLAFIGGSFKQQVHSVMEALGQGCFVLVGPHHLNNREAIEFQTISVNSHPLVSCVHTSEELTKAVQQHLQNSQYFQKLSQQQLQQQHEHYLHSEQQPVPAKPFSKKPALESQDKNLKTLVQAQFNLKTKATELTYKEIQAYTLFRGYNKMKGLAKDS